MRPEFRRLVDMGQSDGAVRYETGIRGGVAYRSRLDQYDKQ